MIKEAIYRSISLFVLAGICEIGGGYLIWKTLKQNGPIWMGVTGAIMLMFYGIVASLQPAGFGRTYAAYGGIFVVMALLWGWLADKTKPDLYDIVGAFIVLAGTAVIFYAPRK